MLHNLVLYLGTPSYHVLSLILAAAAALQSLVALWAATSPRHWFWRALAVWCAVMALVPIRAYQPAVTFAMSSLAIVFLVRALRSRVLRNQQVLNNASAPTAAGFRFRLSDIFLLMVVVGLWLAGMLHVQRRLPRFHVENAALSAAVVAIVAVSAWAVVHSPRRAFRCTLLLLAIVLLAALIPFLGSNSEDYDAWTLLGVTFVPNYLWNDVGKAFVPLAELALLLLTFLSLMRARSYDAGSQRAGSPRVALPLLAALLVLPLAAIYWQMLWLAPVPPPFGEGTTRFHRLVQLAGMVTDYFSNAGTSPGEQESKNNLLAEVRKLAQESNYVPVVEDAESRSSIDNGWWEAGRTIRDLARTINGEAAAAFSRGEQQQACDLVETNIRLAVMLERGGTIPEYLIGVAIHGLASQLLTGVRHDLSPDQARQLIAAYQRALAECEDIHSVVQRDQALAERTYGWAARLENIIRSTGIPSDTYHFVRADMRQETAIHLLQTDLAIRLYQRERGVWPQLLDELVPAYLPARPVDPSSPTAQALRYRVEGDSFILYSVGNDGLDNGGRLTNSRTYYWHNGSGHYGAGYDYDLDTHIRP
jgi:hypothetical protein